MHIDAHLDVDVVALESEDTVTVMLDLVAPKAATVERPESAVVVVLDRSGSMAGDRLAHAKQALVDLVARLDENDAFGLVTFDSSAAVVVPAGRVGDLGRDRIRAGIESVDVGGMTDLSSGYLRGLQEAERVSVRGGTSLIVLSDGRANSGVTDPVAFRGMAQKAATGSVTTSSIGIGTGYDDQILSELAIGGSGNHLFAVDGDAAAAALASEIDGLLAKSVQAASLLVRPSSDVASIGVVNDLPVQRVPEGVLLELGDFYSAESRRILLRVEVPAMAGLGLAQVASCEFNFVSVPELQAHKITVPISVNVVPQDIAKGRVPNAVVEQEKLIQSVQKEKRASEQALRRGDEESARRTLQGSHERLRKSCQGPMSEDVEAELQDVDRSLRDLDRRGAAYTSRGLSESRSWRSRGKRRSDYRRRSDGSTSDSGSDSGA